MAVRMLAYTALLYQRLIADGALRERSVLPPVLPVVIYNGRQPWTVPVDVAELIASGRGGSLARYQPSQLYFLLDEGRVSGPDLPSGNLVSALIALEANRDPARVPALLGALIALLRKQDDEALTAAFGEWVEQVLVARRFRGSVSEPLLRLEEVRPSRTACPWRVYPRVCGAAHDPCPNLTKADRMHANPYARRLDDAVDSRFFEFLERRFLAAGDAGIDRGQRSRCVSRRWLPRTRGNRSTLAAAAHAKCMKSAGVVR